ncbi:MAG TPA: septation protein IspZ [Nevskiaceae bacterium]|nr:septation protein IspZ [Nevskiaceae bacterium]
MNSLLDLIPALLFFGAYLYKGIYAATAVLIVAMFALVAVYWFKDHRLHKLYLVTAIVAGVFGGLTLYLRDPLFIKLKPTVAYGLIAIVFLASQFIGKKVVLARIPQKVIELPDAVWRRLNLAWVGFFVFCALLNLYIAYGFSEKVWVNFNVFGFTALTFVFLLAHAPFLMHYLPSDDPKS